MVEKELHGIDVDGIGNLVDLPRLVFIHKEHVGILKWSWMVGNLLEIITKRRGQRFYNPIDVNSVINAVDEIEVDMIFLAVAFKVGCK